MTDIKGLPSNGCGGEHGQNFACGSYFLVLAKLII